MKVAKSEYALSIGEVSRLLHVSPGILRIWEREGLITPERTKGRHRVYRQQHVRRLRKVIRLYYNERLNPAAIRRELGRSPEPSAEDSYVDEKLGEKLRMLRKQRKMTLVQTAESSGLSPSFISALERGNTGVSMEALFRLGEALRTTLPTLKGEELPPATRRFVPADQRPRFVTQDKSIIIEDIISKPAGMEAEISHIAPGGHSNGIWSHKGQEFVYVLSGQLSLWLEPDEEYELKTGDTLYFHSHLMHRWKNNSDETTVVLWVNAFLPEYAQVRSESEETGRISAPQDED